MTTFLKRRPLVLRGLAAAAVLAAGLTGSPLALAQTKLVAVTSIVEHPALNAVRDGVKEALEAAGYKEGQNLRWEFQSAQGNPGTAASIARKFIGDKADVIVAIATPSAQAVVAATRSIPVVFSAVTDPVGAQLVKSMGPNGGNVTGVSDVLPLQPQVDLILKVAPHARRVGMVYNPGEANSVAVVNGLKALLAARGMELVESTAPRTVDITAAARNLVGKVDVIYTNTDNNVVSAYEALVKVGNDAKVPLVASDTDSVKRGAIAALGVDYKELGRETGRQVARILKGEKPGSIPVYTSVNLQLFVNPAAAKAQGVRLGEAFIQSATQVIQ
ncbi:MAG: ABC transporter substrate-binding protein [Burkholderiaceae bacterium]|nr:ABC transporter substrate-binding protein [Burkholderiaceae bacterium]